MRELERKVILKVLQNCHWNRKQAARALSISYRALLYKIRDAGLPSNRAVKRREAKIPSRESQRIEPRPSIRVARARF